MVAASMQVWKHSGTPCSWQQELHITGFIPAKKDKRFQVRLGLFLEGVREGVVLFPVSGTCL